MTLAEATSRVHARLLAEGSGIELPTRVAALVREEAPLLGPGLRAAVVEEVMAQVAGLGPLEPLLADAEVTEVMVNGPGRVWIERGGVLERIPTDLDAEAIEHLIEKVVAPLGLRVDRSSPLVDARLPDGSRVNAVVPPLAIDGPYLSIRRFAARPIPLSAFASAGVVALLAWAVQARFNILVSGGTGAGKTTLLNALGTCISRHERVVTVEDAAELRLPGDHIVRLEARPANAEGVGEIRVRELVRNALRMRPDRIIVGEVRGPEALDMLQAMNTGHEGSLSTCHANAPDDALRRLETMVLMGDIGLPLDAVQAQLESALDLVVQVGRGADGARRVVAVAEVIDRAAMGRPSGARRAPPPGRTLTMADADGVRRLPTRPPRLGGAVAPDLGWVSS
ncbi:MAG TPA: CpaF family protein [Acidimicrobiales bacterium]|nr:CpaF family protein [Acidimicrobiales bacterium]